MNDFRTPYKLLLYWHKANLTPIIDYCIFPTKRNYMLALARISRKYIFRDIKHYEKMKGGIKYE